MVTNLLPKKLSNILEEDRSLSEKITCDEFVKGKTIPQYSDIGIEEAYEEYLEIKSGRAL